MEEKLPSEVLHLKKIKHSERKKRFFPKVTQLFIGKATNSQPNIWPQNQNNDTGFVSCYTKPRVHEGRTALYTHRHQSERILGLKKELQITEASPGGWRDALFSPRLRGCWDMGPNQGGSGQIRWVGHPSSLPTDADIYSPSPTSTKTFNSRTLATFSFSSSIAGTLGCNYLSYLCPCESLSQWENGSVDNCPQSFK